MTEASKTHLQQILRAQAWQRAKGELQAVLVTFYGESEKFGRLDNEVTRFINFVDDEGLAE